MRAQQLSPNSLVATAESIRGGLVRPEQRQALIAAGFEWTQFEHDLADLQAAGIGFARGYYPIRLQLDDPAKRAKVTPLLTSLRGAVDELRKLAPQVFAGPEQIQSRIQCTVPDGTPHSQLAGLDPSNVYIIALQDQDESIHAKLPLLSRMTSAWAIYLFGNYLGDADLAPCNFRQFSQLRELDLAENNLTRLPAGVVDCTKLERLSLARNANLRVLPPELPRLRSLRALDLSGTNLGAQALRQVTAALPGCQIRV